MADTKQKLMTAIEQFVTEYDIYPQLCDKASDLLYKLKKAKPYTQQVERVMRRIAAEFKLADITSNLVMCPAGLGPSYVFGIGGAKLLVPVQYTFHRIMELINRTAAAEADAAEAEAFKITFHIKGTSNHLMNVYDIEGTLNALTALDAIQVLDITFKRGPITHKSDDIYQAQLVGDKPAPCLGDYIMVLQQMTHALPQHNCTIDEDKHLNRMCPSEKIGSNRIEWVPTIIANLPQLDESAEDLPSNFVGIQIVADAKLPEHGDVLVCTGLKKVQGSILMGFVAHENTSLLDKKKMITTMLATNCSRNGFNVTSEFIYIELQLVYAFFAGCIGDSTCEIIPSQLKANLAE